MGHKYCVWYLWKEYLIWYELELIWMALPIHFFTAWFVLWFFFSFFWILFFLVIAGLWKTHQFIEKALDSAHLMQVSSPWLPIAWNQLALTQVWGLCASRYLWRRARWSRQFLEQMQHLRRVFASGLFQRNLNHRCFWWTHIRCIGQQFSRILVVG